MEPVLGSERDLSLGYIVTKDRQKWTPLMKAPQKMLIVPLGWQSRSSSAGSIKVQETKGGKSQPEDRLTFQAYFM